MLDGGTETGDFYFLFFYFLCKDNSHHDHRLVQTCSDLCFRACSRGPRSGVPAAGIFFCLMPVRLCARRQADLAHKERWVVARNEEEAKAKAATILGCEADQVRAGWGGKLVALCPCRGSWVCRPPTTSAGEYICHKS